MDNNSSDPNNPLTAPGLGQPAAPPADSVNAPWQVPAQPGMPQAPVTEGMNQPAGAPAANPWDNPNQSVPVQNPTSDIFTAPAQPPVEAPPSAPAAWPSSTAGFRTQEPQAPAAPGLTPSDQPTGFPPVGQELPNPMAANPFLQPQSAGGMPENPQSGSDLGQTPAAPAQSMPALESVMPAAPVPEQAPIESAPLEQASMSPTQVPAGNAFPPLDTAGSTNSVQPQNPAIPEGPTAFPAEQPVGSVPQAPIPEMPSQTTPSPEMPGQQGTLDLSSLQSNSGSPENPLPAQPEQPVTPLPDMGPQENAPTDLSHLIAGDESHHQPGDVYAPTVAQDQNPAVSPVQSPTATDGSTPPPGKHLNLTKVLLVAGIPIILIVAALSAYLILGIGKPAAPDTTNQTSLPVEQTKQQAPLTNPPQQIIAPSPVSIPEPQTQGVGLTGTENSASGAALPKGSVSPSPAASLSPAMQAALKKASPSPSSSPATR